MSIKTIIFDLDGTLINTIEDLTDAMNYGLSKLGYDTYYPNDCKLMVGNGFDAFCLKALPSDQSNKLSYLKPLVQNRYKEIYLNKTKPYPDVLKTLDDLKKRGYQMAVYTNKDQDMAQNIVNVLFGDFFSKVVGAINGVAVKPEPENTFQLLKDLKTTPKQTIMVGDSNVDMLTANKAGLTAVGVSYGFRGSKELKEHGADVIIDNASQILELVP